MSSDFCFMRRGPWFWLISFFSSQSVIAMVSKDVVPIDRSFVLVLRFI